MNLERTAHIVRQLAQALSAAQNSGICHRDVKPENIMLQSLGDSEEQAKLLVRHRYRLGFDDLHLRRIAGHILLSRSRQRCAMAI